MENNIFKSVAFGGFDKQDVIGYIERTAREAAEALAPLRRPRPLADRSRRSRPSWRPWRLRTPACRSPWPGRVPAGRSWRP